MKPIGTLALAALLAAGPVFAESHQPEIATELQPVSAFEDIENDDERASALFTEMAKVLQHPRCLNCHPVEGGPLQGDDMQPHDPPVVRGAGGMGAIGMQCNTCHGAENVAFTGAEGSIPGHSPWMLAPLSMGWIGLTVPEICAQLKDPERNGNRDLAAIHEHNAEDGLVGWGWHPGEGRTPVPGTQEQFGELTQAWIDAGAGCPS